MSKLTRLDRLLFRLEAQRICLHWAFDQIAGIPGVVFEMGLGHGRTYDHLRTHLPDREIYVLDREIDSFDDCVPPDDRFLMGDIADTLAEVGRGRFSGKVILAHADLGSYTEEHNFAMIAKLNGNLPSVLAPRAIVISDLPLELAGVRRLPLPLELARTAIFFIARNEAPGPARRVERP